MRPSTSGRTPVAMGSSVPRCPMERSPTSRRALATTSCEVHPAGLSTTITPLIGILLLSWRLSKARWSNRIGPCPGAKKGKPLPCCTSRSADMIPLKDDAPRISTPFVTYTLIAMNTIAFLLRRFR